MKKTEVILLCVMALLVVGAWRIMHPTGEVVTDLLFGWIAFLARSAPKLEVRWDGIAVLLIGLIALIVLGHGFLRWLYRASAAKADVSAPPRVWRLRWTAALVGFIVLMFVAGISVIGTTHQIAWLCRSPEPMFGESLLAWSGERRDFNLSYVGVGVADFHNVYRRWPNRTVGREPRAPQSWVTQLLPYLNYAVDEFDPRLPWNHPDNVHVFRCVVDVLINPEFRNPPLRDGQGYALNHYAGNTRVFDSMERIARRPAPDGTAHLLLIGEVSGQFVPWGQPENSREPTRGFGTPEGFCGAGPERGAQFVLEDGSVRFLAEGIDPRVLEQLSNPADAAAE
jgi:hypothetical protein